VGNRIGEYVWGWGWGWGWEGDVCMTGEKRQKTLCYVNVRELFFFWNGMDESLEYGLDFRFGFGFGFEVDLGLDLRWI